MEDHKLQTALAIIQLLNAATPGIANLVLLIKNNASNTISVVALLNDASTTYAEDMKQAQAWLAAQKTV
jgi:hypothetical protein